MLDGLDNELRMRETSGAIKAGSLTAQNNAIRQKYAPQSGNPMNVAPAIIGEAIGGPGAAAGLTAAKAVWNHASNALTAASLNRLKLKTARGLVATGPELQEFLGQVGRATRSGPLTNALAKHGSNAVNFLTRTGGNALASTYAPPLTIHRDRYLSTGNEPGQ
jgi:hypothetical protein